MPDELEQYELHHRARIAIKPGMGSFLVAVGKCLADYESKIRNIRILKLILPVAIIVLYVEGILVSKIDSECIINITFTTVIAAIVLVAFMISLPQIEANKNARNISTVIYLCHPWIIFAVGSLEHFEIACNGWVKVAEKDMSVQSWLAKEDVRPTYYKNRVNAGLHVIDPKVLDMVAIDADKIGTVDKTTGKTVKVDLDRQLLKPLAGTGKMFCYDSPEYVKDMGTPDRFHQVEEDFKAGRVSAKNLSNKQKAVFLDRDGTINKYVGFLRNINDFELIDGVAEAIKKINASGYLAIVVTNQPVVARGEVAFQELEEIHNKMETELGLQGAYLDAIYYCPHHPHKGYEGEVPELKIECDCRKPKPGMLLKAADDYNIDLSQSYMIGDGENDIKAGLAAGCKAILVNGAGTDAKNEDFGQADTLSSVLEFVDKYLQ